MSESKRPRTNRSSNNKNSSTKSRSSKPKEVEINIDRRDINKADLPVEDHGYTVDSKKRRSKDGNRKEFWNHYPELVRDAASITLAYPIGTPIEYNTPATTPPYSLPSIPGICRMNCMMTIGQPIGAATDPINTAANKLYTFVRRNVSTYANYDSPDLMMYLLAMDSIYALYSWAARVYGIANVYKVYNRYYPVAVLQSMGVDYDSILSNLADFRYGLNNVAFKMAQFCVPSGYALFQRHIEMFGTLYLDSNTVKAQTYYYDLDGYYQFQEVTSGPAKLAYITKRPSSGFKYSDILSWLNSCLNNIMNSQDCIAMSGDILRAFGADKTYSVSPIAENYFVEPVFSSEMLSQFENAMVMGAPVTGLLTGATNDILQSTDLTMGANLMQQLTFGYTTGITDAIKDPLKNLFLANKLVNFHLDNVTPDDVMVATRLMNVGGRIDTVPTTSPNASVYTPEITGTEVLLGCYYSHYSTSGQLVTNSYTAPNIASAVPLMQAWVTFDWAPRYNFINSQILYEFMDYDNYGIINASDMYNLHQTAWMSALANDDIVMLGRKPVNK